MLDLPGSLADIHIGPASLGWAAFGVLLRTVGSLIAIHQEIRTNKRPRARRSDEELRLQALHNHQILDEEVDMWLL